MYTSDMYIAILGRQSALGLAELERVYGGVSRFSHESARLEYAPDIQRLGGSLKAGKIVLELPRGDWRAVHAKILQHYEKTGSLSITKSHSASVPTAYALVAVTFSEQVLPSSNNSKTRHKFAPHPQRRARTQHSHRTPQQARTIPQQS